MPNRQKYTMQRYAMQCNAKQDIATEYDAEQQGWDFVVVNSQKAVSPKTI